MPPGHRDPKDDEVVARLKYAVLDCFFNAGDGETREVEVEWVQE